MNSESTNEIKAPNIRIGDYQQALKAGFTTKELGEIQNGASAEVTMNFTLLDELPISEQEENFEKSLHEYEKTLWKLNGGVFIDIHASRSMDGYEYTDFDNLYEDIEIQLDIPLYLVAENRNYYLITDIMGSCELLDDVDEEADTLSVSTHYLGTSMMIYQDEKDMLVRKENKIRVKTQYLIIGGIVILLLGWWAVEKLYRRDRD